MAETVEAQLITHLEDAQAMERDGLRMLDALIMNTHDPELVADFKRHTTETHRHVKKLGDRLAVYRKQRSLIGDVFAFAGAAVRAPIDFVRPERVDSDLRNAYATQHSKIASYELLERIADIAGDAGTAKVARENRADDEAMAERIERRWDRAAEQSLMEAGVVIAPSARRGAKSRDHQTAKSASSARRRPTRNGAARSKVTTH